MLVRILVPVVLVGVVMFLFWTWYRRTISDLAPDQNERPLPGARLTAERLRNMRTPPWRVVYEIGPSALGDVDHVVIGPTGVIAIETVMADRPTPAAIAEQVEAAGPHLVANCAITRGEVEAVTEPVGVGCKLLARVYWGAPADDQPAAHPVTTGLVAVEGQRLEQWLMSLPPGPLSADRVDRVWQSVVTGIGRPDPLG